MSTGVLYYAIRKEAFNMGPQPGLMAIEEGLTGSMFFSFLRYYYFYVSFSIFLIHILSIIGTVKRQNNNLFISINPKRKC